MDGYCLTNIPRIVACFGLQGQLFVISSLQRSWHIWFFIFFIYIGVGIIAFVKIDKYLFIKRLAYLIFMNKLINFSKRASEQKIIRW